VNLVLAAETLAKASSGSINRAWGATFVLAALTLLAFWFLFPGASGLVLGKDRRVSTSKFQVVIWTFAVAFALFSLFFAFVIPQLFGELLGLTWAERLQEPIGDGFATFLSEGLDETYLLLLGFPLAAAVSSKAITSSKVAKGEVKKPKKTDPSASSPAQELVGDDQGDVDLGDFQYLLFTLLAVAYFLAQFVSHPSGGLPDMPDTLVGLTGVAAAAYVGKKGVYKEPPVLLGVIPPTAQPGAWIEVYGKHLLSGDNSPPVAGDDSKGHLGAVVMIHDLVAPLRKSASQTNEKLTVKVPDVVAGAAKLKVIRPPGAESEELPFTVLAKD
jgi:hypothetical protein